MGNQSWVLSSRKTFTITSSNFSTCEFDKSRERIESGYERVHVMVSLLFVVRL